MRNLTADSVPKTITAMTLPMIMGMLSIVAFNLIDTFFIGKLGTKALAAMSFTLPVVMLQGAISMGLGVGASAVISQAIGRKDTDSVKRLTTDALILSLSLVIIIVIIGLVTIDPLFRSMGASEIHLPLIREYMFIWYLGVPFVVIPMVGNNAIRATGNISIPSLIMFLSVSINVILDPLFIFGIGIFPEWGLKGAAVATVIARAASLIISLSILHFKFNMITIRFDSFHKMKQSWSQILYIAVPTALTQVLMPFSMAFLTRLVSSYGEDAVAAIGISNRIEMFALSPIMALGAVLIPFTGQNMGAGKSDRISEGIKFSNLFSLLIGISILLIFLIFRQKLAYIFTDKGEVVSIVSTYLTIVSLGYGFQGICRIGSSAFSALNKPINAGAVNFIRLLLFFVPLTLIGSRYWELKGIFGAIAISSILSGLITVVWLRRYLAKIDL